MKSGWVLGHTACMALLLGGAVLSLSPCAAVSGATQSKPETAAEADLKVAYTIAFLKFLSHSEGDARTTDSAVHVCVIGDGSVARAFARADGAVIQLDTAKTLVINTDPSKFTCSEQKRCWAVYVDHANRHRVSQVADTIRGKGVLLVTESKGALDDGAMVNLLRSGDRLRWEMSRTHLQAAKVSMSSQVYRNAIRVK